MSITVACLLGTAIVPGYVSERIVTVHPAVDPMVRRVPLVRPRSINRFAAPVAPLDLTRRDVELPAVTIPSAARRSLAVVTTRPAERGVSTATLVATPPDDQLGSRPIRRSVMVGGLTMRVTNEDTVLEPRLFLAGAGGKALTWMAVQAIERK